MPVPADNLLLPAYALCVASANFEEESLSVLPAPANWPNLELNCDDPSLRLDNIVSDLFKTSRSKAKQIIEQERVFVNYEVITKPTKQIKENDKITIRGKGRFEVKQILGNTRKGRIMVEIEK